MKKESIFQKMSLHAKRSFVEAENIANFYGAEFIEIEHLLFAIFLEKGSLGSNILHNSGLKQSFFNDVLQKTNKVGKIKAKTKEAHPDFSQELKQVIIQAYSLATKFKYPYVGTEHLTFAILEKPNKSVRQILLLSEKNKKKVKENKQQPPSKIINEIPNSNIQTASLDNSFIEGLMKIFDIHSSGFPIMNENEPENETPNLDYFCVDLNQQVKETNHKIIGRQQEIEQIASALGRKNKNNPLLVGDPGVGKTALIEGLAKKINSGQVPSHLLDKRILSLDMALVVAGTTFRGEFEERLKDIIQEASANENIILFIDEIHSIIGAGNVSGGLDAANILKPALTRGEIQCIGATTFAEYKKHIEKDPALERRFQTIAIKEPNKSETEKILAGIKKDYEKFHNVAIKDNAVKQAVNLSSRYIRDRFQPDKSIDLLDETSARLRSKNKTSDFFKKIKQIEKELEQIIRQKHSLIEKEDYEEALKLRSKEERLTDKLSSLKKERQKFEQKHPLIIGGDDIAETVSIKTKIPLSKILSRSERNIAGLGRRLKARVIGQNKAIDNLHSTILRSQSGVSDTNKPIGSFLFLGPSGVGKTLTAKVLAEEFFGDKKALVKIDMSEFMERHSVAQLLGSPAGYVGYGEGGRLTEQVRHQPYSLILFDEIEKAHPDVFNILLQLLEEGVLTDAEGRSVDFRNTIIILTSNIGTEEFTQASAIGFGDTSKNKTSLALQDKFSEIKAKVLRKLEEKMKPEILNRLDYTIVFNVLSPQEIKRIVVLELKELSKRLKEQKITLSYSKRVIDLLAKKSFSENKGARLVKEKIRDLIETPLAEVIIARKKQPDFSEIKLDAKNEKIVIQTK